MSSLAVRGGLRRRWRQGRRRPWRECEFVALDFETTGLDPRRCRPLSVGWVPVREGRLVLAEAGYTPIRAEGEIDPATIAVHRLLPSDLTTAPPMTEVAEELTRVLAGRTLVAHGAHLELALLRRAGVPVRRRAALDTIRLSLSLDRLEEAGAGGSRTLSSLARRLGLPAHRPHHAFGDALTTGGVFLALATRFERHGAGRLADLVRHGHA